MAKRPQMMILDGDGSYQIEVVGESRYLENLKSIARDDNQGDGVDLVRTAYMVPEPRNPNDRNAVRVDIGERPVGYLRRELAAALSPALLASGVTAIQVRANITAGFGGGNYSVWLDGSIDEALAFLRPAKPRWQFW